MPVAGVSFHGDGIGVTLETLLESEKDVDSFVRLHLRLCQELCNRIGGGDRRFL